MPKQRFTPRQKFNKTNAGKTPNNKPAVYKIFNNKGENVYTGKAKKGRLQQRLKEHMPSGPDGVPGADSFSIKQKKSIGGAGSEEQRIIRQENPKHNEQGT